MRRLASRLLIAALLAAPMLPNVLSARCEGDCDADAEVRVDELVRAVRIALGAETPDCPAADADGDGAVRVDEIVLAINRSLAGCDALIGSDAIEASVDVALSAYRASTAVDFIDLAALLAPDPCSDGGRAERSCSIVAGRSQRNIRFLACRDADPASGNLSTRDGDVLLSSDDPAGCETTSLPPARNLTYTTALYTERTTSPASQPMRTLELRGFRLEGVAAGTGCAGISGTFVLDGSLRTMFAGGPDLRFDYDNVRLDASFDVESCERSLLLNGEVGIEDVAAARRFALSALNFFVADLPSGLVDPRPVRESGVLLTDCLGSFTLDTIEPLRIRLPDHCPSSEGAGSAGLLQSQLAIGTVRTIRFTAAGGVQIGLAPARGSCVDPSLARCSHALPTPASTRTARPTSTATETGRPTSTVTSTRTSAPAAPTVTRTPSPTSTPIFTNTPAPSPTVTVTPTAVSPTASGSPTPTPSRTSSRTPSRTITGTPTDTPTIGPSPTPFIAAEISTDRGCQEVGDAPLYFVGDALIFAFRVDAALGGRPLSQARVIVMKTDSAQATTTIDFGLQPTGQTISHQIALTLPTGPARLRLTAQAFGIEQTAEAVCSFAIGLPGTCSSACDCPSGQACVGSGCAAAGQPVYCCTSSTCPRGALCQRPDGTFTQCV